jgi:hypothetical protein
MNDNGLTKYLALALAVALAAFGLTRLLQRKRKPRSFREDPIGALKDRGVPTELVIYPREPHGLRERAHNLDRLRRYMAWFKRYV